MRFDLDRELADIKETASWDRQLGELADGVFWERTDRLSRRILQLSQEAALVLAPRYATGQEVGVSGELSRLSGYRPPEGVRLFPQACCLSKPDPTIGLQPNSDALWLCPVDLGPDGQRLGQRVIIMAVWTEIFPLLTEEDRQWLAALSILWERWWTASRTLHLIPEQMLMG
jgi:hypothetical protein